MEVYELRLMCLAGSTLEWVTLWNRNQVGVLCEEGCTVLARAEGEPFQQKGPADLMELREGIQAHWPQTSLVDARRMSNE